MRACAPAARARLVLGAVLLSALLGCTDPGVIGTVAAELECEPACAGDERCDLELETCVPCGEGDACEPEPPPPPADAGECDDDDCPEPCADGETCSDDAPLCVEGRCVQCEEDSDCDGSGDLECEDGSCVLSDEE